MKRAGIILIFFIVISCAPMNKSGMLPEDELFITRKFVGNFIEGVITPPEHFGNPPLLSISTSLDSLYGRISVYSGKCEFVPGDRLYLRRVYQATGIFGSWVYQIENETPERVKYQVSGFQSGKKVLAQSWF
ncbi:MAG TPA: hypothetical protein DCZ51_14385 [Bacteroidales bacterium]|nr:hypothetical protein [Bacteroidales bacterium]